jgi:sugar phosphate isomerase/epimerase
MLQKILMKYAVCNEMFGSIELERAAGMLAEEGFDGVEAAPFTIFGDFSPAAVRRGIGALRSALASSGLAFAGFHWLFAGTPGASPLLHFTSPDKAARQKAAARLELLLEAAGELGGGALVFGSPKERSSGGFPRSEALARLAGGLAAAAPLAEKAGCRILLEALPAAVTDIVNTLGEARELILSVGRPGLGGMFDFHNTTEETESWDVLLTRYWDIIGHVHINEMDGSHPAGRGKADFGPAFSVLHSLGFAAWVSLEIFHIPERPREVLREVREFLKIMEDIQ